MVSVQIINHAYSTSVTPADMFEYTADYIKCLLTVFNVMIKVMCGI